MKRSLLAVALGASLLAWPASGQEFLSGKAPGKSIRIDQHLNQRIPLDAIFRDEQGREVRLQEYFGGEKPVILNFVYYGCPMLCNMVLNGLHETLRDIKLTVGKEFTVVTISFDPRDTPKIAADKKEKYIRRYGRPGAAAGWHFLTGEPSSIKRITDAVGFKYAWDPQSKQFAHGSTIMVLTPDGRIARYFHGINYPPKDVRLGLVEASKGQIGTLTDQLLLLCYHYDPSTGKYTPAALGFVRASGALMVLGLGGFLFRLVKKEKKKLPKTGSGQ